MMCRLAMLHVVVEDLLDDIARELDRQFVRVDSLYDAVPKFRVGNAIADFESAGTR